MNRVVALRFFSSLLLAGVGLTAVGLALFDLRLGVLTTGVGLVAVAIGGYRWADEELK
jgi:hypothetical protein